MIGTRTMVAFRVTINGMEPSVTADRISKTLFGLPGGRGVSLRSEYERCSFNKLHIVPGEGDNFKNGVAEIEVQGGSDAKSFESITTKKINEIYGDGVLQRKYNHIAYILPYGTVHSGRKTWIGSVDIKAVLFLNSFSLSDLLSTSFGIHVVVASHSPLAAMLTSMVSCLSTMTNFLESPC